VKVTKKIEKLENSSVKLTVTIEKKEVAKNYEETVAKYAKNVQLPGFRKGKVPVSILERKYGEALKADVVADIIEKALGEVFDDLDKNDPDNRPLPYAQPKMDEAPEMDITKDLTFTVTYDVMPKVSVTDFSGITVKEPQVTVGEAELNEELKAIQERNAVVLEKKDGDVVAKDDIVTVNYCELDDKGEVIETSKREGFVFTVGTEQNIYKIDNDVIGMKKDESKDLTKKYKKDFENEDLAGKTVKLRVTVTAIKVKNLPELDDELAQDVNEKYKTLDDLKKDITKNLEVACENKVREMKSNNLIDQLIEKYPFALPESLVEAELASRWRMMAQQFQTTPEQLDKMVAASGQTKADMLKQWTGDSEKMLKGRIIVESLLKANEITITPEDVEAEYAKIADGAGISVEEVKKHYADASRKEYLIDDMKEQKLYADLFTKVKVTKGDKIAFADLFKN
jgi:trigger factor